MARLLLSAGLVLCCVSSAASALADPTESVASTAFREGRDALKAGKFELACSRFRVSEDAEPSSGARLNLGDCALRRGEYVEAERLYKGAALLAEGEKRTFAEQRATAARAQAGTLRLRWSGPAPASGVVEIDGQRVGVPAQIAVNPGRHTVKVTASGYPTASQNIDVATGAAADVNLAPLPPAAPALRGPPRAIAEPASRSPAAYVLFGVSGLALAGGVVSGLVATGARDDLDTKCAGQKPCAPEVFARDDVRGDFDRAKTWALISTTCFVGAAVALVAGGTLWLVTAPSPSGSSVALAGRF